MNNVRFFSHPIENTFVGLCNWRTKTGKVLGSISFHFAFCWVLPFTKFRMVTVISFDAAFSIWNSSRKQASRICVRKQKDKIQMPEIETFKREPQVENTIKKTIVLLCKQLIPKKEAAPFPKHTRWRSPQGLQPFSSVWLRVSPRVVFPHFSSISSNVINRKKRNFCYQQMELSCQTFW